MVWADITHYGRSYHNHTPDTLNSVHYRNTILQHHVLSFPVRRGGVFQHYNARAHVVGGLVCWFMEP